MLEVIGFIVWVLATIGLTILPFILALISGLSGGIDTEKWLVLIILFLLAIWSWVNIFSKITINLGG